MTRKSQESINLRDRAISELIKMLESPNEKIKLRAISLILRHDIRTSSEPVDEDIKYLDDLITNWRVK